MPHLICRGVIAGVAMGLLGIAAIHAQPAGESGSPVRPLVRSSTPGPGTVAPTGGTAGADLSAPDRAFLQTHGRRIAEQFALIDGKFYASAGWDRRYPSSARVTADRWRLDNSQSQRVAAFTGLVRTKRYYPPREEVELATTHLPDLSAGSFGHIHSAKVVAVLGPMQMLVTDIWLVDEAAVKAERERDEKLGERIIERMKQDEADEREWDREQQRRRSGSDSDRDRRYDCAAGDADIGDMIEWRYRQRDEAIEKQHDFGATTLRLVGFSTATAVPGKRWPIGGAGKALGPQIAIVGEEAGAKASKTGRSSSSRPIVIAINADAMKKPADDAHLHQLIAATGMTPAEFVKLAQGMMREHGAEAMLLIVAAIDKARLQHAASQASASQSPAPSDAGARAKPGDAAPGQPAKKSSWFEEKYKKK